MSFPRYQAYKTSEVEWLEEVPEHWILNKIGMISSLKGRLGWQGLKADEYKDEGPYVLSSAHFKHYQIQWEECPRVTEERYEADANIQLAVNDVLLMKDGAAMGKLAFIESLPGKACLNSHLLLFRPIKIDGALTYHQKFAFYFMQTRYFQEYIRVNGTGATFLGISQDAIGRYKVCWPPLREQTQIASFLDHETAKIDNLITEQERLIKLLQEKRQAVISHAVTKGLNPNAPMKDSGVEWLGEVPEHWRVKSLKRISPAVVVGIVVNPSSYFSDEGLPFVHAHNIKNNKIDLTGIKKISPSDSLANKKSRLEEGDIVTYRVGEKRGLSAVVTQECEGGNCASVMLTKRGNFDSNWLLYALIAANTEHQIRCVEYGAAQPCFNISDAKEFIFAYPPNRQEQSMLAKHIDKECDRLNSLIENCENSINLLKERRSALISAAVTGQIDVRGLAPTAEDV